MNKNFEEYKAIVESVFNPFYELDKNDKKLNEEYLKPQTPYMLRDDGKLLTCGRIHPYIKYNGWNDNRNEIEHLFNDNLDYLKWFYENTNKQITRDNIELFVSMIVANRIYFDISKDVIKEVEALFPIYNEANCDQETIEELFEQLNNDTNQEFCRLRTSHMKAPIGNSGKVYFKISSNEFNWFDLIWNLIYSNKNFITNISICTDTQSKGGRVYFYKHNGQEINEMPVDDFLNLSGNPVIESNNEIINGLRKGKLLEELTGSIPSHHLNYLHKLIEENYLNETFLNS